MKKIVAILLMTAIALSCCSCSHIFSGAQKNWPAAQGIQPQLVQVKSICNLATVECYYRNVAKYDEKDGKGFWVFNKDRKFWIEYAGVVTYGIDFSRVQLSVEGNVVTITLPHAQVLDVKLDDSTLNENSFYVDHGSAKVGIEHQSKAMRLAQEKMRESASSDRTLLGNAETTAERLLQEYVSNIGKCTGTEYTVKFVYID